MKKLLPRVLLLLVSAGWCRADPPPISGDLLDLWRDPSSGCVSSVTYGNAVHVSGDVYELRIACLEVGEDSLDVFLLGLAPETGIPLLLAGGGYRGPSNSAKIYASFYPEEDSIHLGFEMPGCAMNYLAVYHWNRESQALELLRYASGDPSLEAMSRVDSLLAAGGIAEAVDELGNMFYPGAYYDSDEMIARLLRAIDREALEAHAAGEGDSHAAVELYRCMDDFFYAPWEEWVTAFSDPEDYLEGSFSGYMGLGEYAMILNNFGFYLEQAGKPVEALIVLEQVLELDPSRMVARLNLADVLWELDRPIGAEEQYAIYRDRMTERGLAEQIPERVLRRGGAAAPQILRRYELPLETHLRVPVHLDGGAVMEDGGLRLQLSRRADPSTFEHGVRDLWSILIDPDGGAALLESLPSSAGIRLTSGILPGDPTGYLFLVARSEGGDTLWTCPLGCDASCHSAFVTRAEGGGWLASIRPDCFADIAPVYRISDSGESVFSTIVRHYSLLDLPEAEGETSPSVQSQGVISSDDVLLTGQVREWMTTPGAWFVCMLDGATGELLWTASGFGAGDAEIADAIELTDGRILAAGSTRDWDESSAARYGTPHPFLVLLDPSGRVLDSLILDESPGGFHSLIAHPAGGDRFLVALCGGDGEELTLLEMTIPLGRDSWSPARQGRTPEEEVPRLVGMIGALDEDVIAAMMTPSDLRLSR